MAIGSANRFDMGRVFERTTGVISANFGVFALLALLLGALPTALFGYVQTEVLGIAPGNPSGLSNPGAWGIWVLSILVSIAMAYTLQAAVTRGAVVSLNGGKATFAECLSTGVQMILPAFAISLLAGLGEMVGFILLIVPGIILAIAWMVAIPVRVMESRGIAGALSRSAELTRGHRWALFGMIIVLGIAYWLLLLMVGLVVGAASAIVTGGNDFLLALIVQPLVGAVASMVSAAFVASVYYELRTIKEGVGADALAKVFE